MKAIKLKESEKYQIEIELSLQDTDPNRTRGKHWSQVRKSQRVIKNEIAILSRSKLPKTPLQNFKISVTRFGAKALDWDNFVASLKPAIDGLTLAKIIKDDSWKYIRHIETDQQISKERKLIIKVMEC